MRENIETIYDASQTERVIIFRRDNGTYGLTWEKFSSDPYELCWISCMKRSESILDNLETARREARALLRLESATQS